MEPSVLIISKGDAFGYYFNIYFKKYIYCILYFIQRVGPLRLAYIKMFEVLGVHPRANKEPTRLFFCPCCAVLWG